MKKAFNSYDKDGNGLLDIKEISDLFNKHMQEQGIFKKAKRAELEDFFAQIDEDGNGSISFDEYKHFMIENMKNRLLKPLANYLAGKGIDVAV